MTPRARIITGDCIEKMRELDEASVDAVVCDPPYALDFMGMHFDSGKNFAEALAKHGTPRMVGEATGISGGFNRIPAGVKRPDVSKNDPVAFQMWCELWGREALRVLKPGGHLLAFGGTRTYHRLTAGLEDAGFEIRDCIMWLYGSGMPKGLDVAMSIDKALRGVPHGGPDPTSAGHGKYKTSRTEGRRGDSDQGRGFGAGAGAYMLEQVTKSEATALQEEAAQWSGWNTALKPAYEPIVMARKPPATTGKGGRSKKQSIAANVLEHGTGALNIDACRIGTSGGGGECPGGEACKCGGNQVLGATVHPARKQEPGSVGRWPANVTLDEGAAAQLDEQVGPRTSGSAPNGIKRNADKFRNVYGEFKGQDKPTAPIYGDTGGVSRFFYCAKASKADREAGLDDLPKNARGRANVHPTTKPRTLMAYLARLVTPPGGVVLDPFMGSGSTGVGCMIEGLNFIGIEMEPEYVQIAAARIKHAKEEHHAH